MSGTKNKTWSFMAFQCTYNENRKPCLPVNQKSFCISSEISCCFSGTKGVAKAMKEISGGAQKWEGEKWFSELSDKRMYHKPFFCYEVNQLVYVGAAQGVVRYIRLRHCLLICQFF